VSSLTLSATQLVLMAVSPVKLQPGYKADLSPVCGAKSRMGMSGSYEHGALLNAWAVLRSKSVGPKLITLQIALYSGIFLLDFKSAPYQKR
jgi:hypothetical protein